jgi:hypothetical protein
LRKSRWAWFARSRYGFEPTGEERRAMMRLRESFPPNASHQEVDAALVRLLSPERFAAYRRSNDSDFNWFSKVASRLDWPADTPAAAYNAKLAAQETAARIRSHPNLPPDQQTAALLDIQAETENHLRQLLGPEVFGTYRRQNSKWLEELSTIDHPTP